MTGRSFDVRNVPPSERHPMIHQAFEQLDSGETLTIVNDHEPKPLYYEFAAEVPSFLEEYYSVEQRGRNEYVAQFPKR